MPFSGRVTLPSFFLADQLVSQTTALADLLYTGCFMVSGAYKGGGGGALGRVCLAPGGSGLAPRAKLLMQLAPLWLRILQCALRLRDEGAPRIHLTNIGKYAAAAAAQLVRYGRDASGGGQGWTAALVMLSLCASTYGFGWDVAMDWALVQSTDPGQLKPGAEGWYRAAVAADALLRLTWVATLTPAGGPGGAAALATALAALEVSRRCLWSFFRIENEHIANANHLQATQQVSLPAPHGEEEGAGGWTVTGLALGGVGRRGEAGASSAALEEAAAGRAQARQAPGEHFNWADADEEGEGGG